MRWLNTRRGRGSENGAAAAPEARIEAMVSGRVQGVGFRWWTRGIAQENDLLGFAENLPDGRVRIIAEGSRRGIEALWDALNSGDTAGKVSDVERSDPAPTGEFDQFGVK
ncbi:acylphosphatase [Kocuria massiliensis]|uniref:acylphosphatase n=1 Tax=Kocuria massiliensis TaxID=1926282 RepID=UPI0022B99280|nr:acylphosphatase [Kocuria massiliensis]